MSQALVIKAYTAMIAVSAVVLYFSPATFRYILNKFLLPLASLSPLGAEHDTSLSTFGLIGCVIGLFYALLVGSNREAINRSMVINVIYTIGGFGLYYRDRNGMAFISFAYSAITTLVLVLLVLTKDSAAPKLKR